VGEHYRVCQKEPINLKLEGAKESTVFASAPQVVAEKIF